MKKIWIIGGVVVVLFVLLIVLTNYSNNNKLKDNPYGTNDLKQETIDQLDDANYQDIILPDALAEKIASGEETIAYFFSPICTHCQKFTPKLMPIAKKMGVEIDQLNVYEFEDAWETYAIEATPTLVVFKDGIEVDRMVGDVTEDEVRNFFGSNVLN